MAERCGAALMRTGYYGGVNERISTEYSAQCFLSTQYLPLQRLSTIVSMIQPIGTIKSIKIAIDQKIRFAFEFSKIFEFNLMFGKENFFRV